MEKFISKMRLLHFLEMTPFFLQKIWDSSFLPALTVEREEKGVLEECFDCAISKE